MRRASDFPWDQQHVSGTSPSHHNQASAVAEQNNGKKKRGKHAPSKDRHATKATESSRSAEMTASPPTLRPQGFGGYLPTGFPTIGEHGSHGNIITSPVLEALGSNADSAYRTDVWAQSVPVGKSPPTDLLGGISTSGSPPSIAPSHVSERGTFTHTPPSSPPQAKARPAGYAAGNPLQKSRPSSHDKMLRPSFGSQLPQPPLPHHTQAHFYGAPNIDLGLGGMGLYDSSRENVLFTKFDIVRQPASVRGTRLHRVAVIGSENRVDVISLQHHKPKAVGGIADLKGQVIDAKILTWESGADPFASFRPLIALVIHGPKIEMNPGPSPKDIEEDSELESSEILPAVAQPNPTYETAAQNQNSEVHTRVDVFSLRSQKRLTTLFATQAQRVEPGFRGLPPTVPPPAGGLRLAVSGNFVFITSASSGEVFVYSVKDLADVSFQCLGKFWTTVQTRDIRRYSSSSASTDASSSPADPSRASTNLEQPLISVSARWLAIVPPGGAGRTSIQGHVPLSLGTEKPPGLDSFTAPPKPSSTCSIDSPDVNSIFNRVARGMAQEVVKGARWMGDQGLQAWNNYWNRDLAASQAHSPLPPRPQAPSIPASYFPPTHGLETQNPSSSDPELVSLIDLSRLTDPRNRKHHQVLEPIATFQPPNGCSYISFTPGGLSLLTSSRKGDIQYVWDLMQVVHQRMAALVTKFPASGDPDPTAFVPLVRQIARFTRLSSASITDVVWSKLPSDRLALITRNGTVHVFDIPPSAFMWPPPRRLTKQPTPGSDHTASQANEKGDSSASEGLLASAWKVAGRAQPVLANLRGRAPSFGTTFSGIGTNSIGFASATGVKGGKAVAAGLSKSVGAASGTVNTLRHAGENRLHLASLAKDPLPGRVCWNVGEKEEVALSVIDGSIVKKFYVRRSSSTATKGQRSKVSSVIEVKRPVEVHLPNLEKLRYAFEAALSQKHHGFEEVDQQTHGYWSLPVINTSSQPSHFSHSHPLSHAEIETNSPYQPFHSDRRVNLAVYVNPSNAAEPEIDPTVLAILSPPDLSDQPLRPSSSKDEETPWAFGTDIPVQQLSLRSASYPDNLEDGNSVIYRETATANKTPRTGEEPAEEVVITTRKRKGKAVAGDRVAMGAMTGLTGEDDDFFEEDLEIVDWVGDRV